MTTATALPRQNAPKGAVARASGVPDLDRGFWSMGARGGHLPSPAEVTERPYERHVWSYACTRAISQNVSRLSPLLVATDNYEDQTSDHEVLRRLMRPNALMTYRTFRQVLTLLLLLPQRGGTGGQAFVVGWNARKDEPADLTSGEMPDELMPFGDDFIEPKLSDASTSGRSRLEGWTWQVPGKEDTKIFLPMSSVIRIHLVNPYNWLKGLAPVYAAQMAIDQDAKSDMFNTRLFDTDGRVAGVLYQENGEELSQEQRASVKASWMAAHSGVGRSSNIALLEGGLKYMQTGLTLADMQYREQKEWARDGVIAATGVNRIAIGQYEDINFATIREGRRILWHDVYMPLDELINDAFSTYWISHIDGGRYKLASDYSKIQALQYDIKDKAVSTKTFVDAGAPFALACRLSGVPLRSEDLKAWPHLEEKPERGGFAAAPAQEGEKAVRAAERAPRVSLSVSKDEREKFGVEYVERVLIPPEKSMLRTMERYFRAQRNRIMDMVDAWVNTNDDGKGFRFLLLRTLPDSIRPSDFLPDRVEEMEVLMKAYRPNAKQQLELETAKLEEELGGLISWNVTDERITYYVNQRRANMSKVNTRTFERALGGIRAALDTAYEQEMTVREFAAEIKRNVKMVYQVRLGEELEPHGKFDLGGMSSSKTIARTEMGIIASEARNDAFGIEGIEYHEWVAYIDERTRLTHAQEDGAVVRVGDVFPATGLRFPRDSSGDPGEIINCRCVAVAKEEEE